MPPERIVNGILRTGLATGGTVAMPNAGSNVAGGTIPLNAKTLYIYSTGAYKVAVGEVTSGSVGIPFGPGMVALDVTSGGTLNFQSVIAGGTLVYAFGR